MTLRIIVRTTDFGAAANVGGDVFTQFRTFDIEAPEVEAFLRETAGMSYTARQVTGVELLAEQEDKQS